MNPFMTRHLLCLAPLVGLLFCGNSAVLAADSSEQPWLFSAQPFGMLTMPELVKPPPPDKKLFLKITTGYQYDTNAIMNAQGTPIPDDIGKKDDSRFVLNLSGSYLPFKWAQGDLTLNYAFFQSQHADLDDFNLTQNLAEIALRHKIAKQVTLRYSTVFHHMLLGSKLFDYAVMTGPSLIIAEGAGRSTVIDLRYRSSEYENVSIFKSNSLRSGSNYSGAISQSLAFSPEILLRVGYAGDVDSTRSPLWDGVGHKVSLQGSFILPRDSLLDVYGEYYRKDYDGIYNSIRGTRTDQAWSAVVTATTYFEDRYGISLRALYSRNISNVAAFNISRVIPSILFDVRF
ncbi:MAG: hypothetical protein A2X82_19450 [Geobacteraceae bacterium GWC2_55_20]|nr:MAG: hypothetical protein A2X82_19450 [Geobacteraceae bacterium GWC2_55_20]OGU21832.1 MAG: hypothetical protein A2X85_11915 [Geobacteraceae bacterium GWF2_54_21]HCE66052.1 hypothetical protein [Geobacter sp.]